MTRTFRASRAQQLAPALLPLALLAGLVSFLFWTGLIWESVGLVTIGAGLVFVLLFGVLYFALLRVVRIDIDDGALVLRGIVGQGVVLRMEDIEAIGTGAPRHVLLCTTRIFRKVPNMACQQTGETLREALDAEPDLEDVVRIGAPLRYPAGQGDLFDKARRRAKNEFLIRWMGSLVCLGCALSFVWGSWHLGDESGYLLAVGALLPLAVTKPFMKVRASWIDRRLGQLNVTGPFGWDAHGVAFADVFFVERGQQSYKNAIAYFCCVTLGDGTRISFEDEAFYPLANGIENAMVPAH